MAKKLLSTIVVLLILGIFFYTQGQGITGGHIADQGMQQAEEISNPETQTLKVASFNIQVLGKSKVSKELVQEYLPQIIREFDIVAIQELRDASFETLETLQQWLPEYEFTVSERLGRSTSKEQYIVLNRIGKVTESYTFTDEQDWFEREPQVSLVQVEDLEFSLMNVHVKPDDVKAEIEALEWVVADTINYFDNDQFLLVGDFNADCRYYDETQDENLENYEWIIDDSADTTVAESSCTYDRIVSSMEYLDSGVYVFEEELGLSTEDAKIISDHYPVWVELAITE